VAAVPKVNITIQKGETKKRAASTPKETAKKQKLDDETASRMEDDEENEVDKSKIEKV
jgi:hypothetical protein